MKNFGWICLIGAGALVGVAYIVAKETMNKSRNYTSNSEPQKSSINVATQEKETVNNTQILEETKSNVASIIKERHNFASDIIKESVGNIIEKQSEMVDDSEFDKMNEEINNLLEM